MVLGLSLLHCCNKKETVAELDEPIQVEWIYRKEWTGGGRFGGVSETGKIEVKREPPVVISAGCWEPKPELGATTDEVAFRCDVGQPWRLAYLAKSGAHAFQHCDEVLGNGAKPNFSGMPPFDVAAPRLVECGATNDRQRPIPNFASLWTEIRMRTNDARLADILIGSAQLPFRTKRDYEGKTLDDWEDGFELLSPAEKKRVDANLEKRLLEKKPPLPLLTRAIWHVSALEPKLEGAYRARADELLPQKRSEAGDRMLMVLLARLHLLGDTSAGELACRALATAESSLASELKIIIAFAKHRCDKAREDLEKNFCALEYDCGDGRQRHLCTKDEVSVHLAEDVRGFATNRAASYDNESPALAAGYVFDELPKNVLLAAERRGYAGPSEGESCFNENMKPDHECDCFSEPHDLEEAVCELDGKTEGYYHKGCRILIDDANKRIRVYPQPKPDAVPPTLKPSASPSASGGD